MLGAGKVAVTTDRFRIAVGSAAWPDNFIHFHDVGGPTGKYHYVYYAAGGELLHVDQWTGAT